MNNNLLLVKTKSILPNFDKKRNTNSTIKTLYRLRAKIKKIHGILEFKQELFLKPYIEQNIDLQREVEKEGN